METNKYIIDDRTIRILEDQYSILYVEAVKDKIHEVARTFCYGCKVAHLSQTQHSCIMLLPRQKLERYFEIPVHGLDDKEILCTWNKCVETMDIDAHQLEVYRRKIFCHHWRNNDLMTDSWKNKLFHTVLRMIKLEERFYH